MNRSIFLFISLLVLSQLTAFSPPRVENTSFTKGEFLKYRMHYGLVTAGYATVEVKKESQTVSGRKCHHIVGKGTTNSTYDWIFKIRDTYETYIDEETLVPWKFVRDIQEGDFKSHTVTQFDQNLNNAYYVDEQMKVTTYKVPSNIQDVISCFYSSRIYDQNKLKAGDKIALTNFLDRKVYKLNAEFMKREVIVVDGVKYKGLKMKLLIDEAGMITDKANIHFWLSDDNNKIPLRIETELTIGSIKADLIEYKNLKNPFSAKI